MVWDKMYQPITLIILGGGFSSPISTVCQWPISSPSRLFGKRKGELVSAILFQFVMRHIRSRQMSRTSTKSSQPENALKDGATKGSPITANAGHTSLRRTETLATIHARLNRYLRPANKPCGSNEHATFQIPNLVRLHAAMQTLLLAISSSNLESKPSSFDPSIHLQRISTQPPRSVV